MANKGDVELTIRARDESTKAVKTITGALTDLSGAQNKLRSSSDSAGTMLTAFAKIATTVGNAYEKITTETEKAQAAFNRQEATLAETRAQYASITSQIEAAARVQERLSKQVETDTAKDKERKQALDLVQKAIQQLTVQSDKTAASLRVQEAGWQRANAALLETRSAAALAADALKQTEAAQQEASQAAQTAAAAQQAAIERVKAAEEAAAAEKITLAQRVAAEQQAAAEKAATLQTAAARRSALEVRRSMGDAAEAARTAWQTAQASLAELSQQVSKSGGATAEQTAEFARLRTEAQASKSVYSGLTQEMQRMRDTLGKANVTQAELTATQQRGKSVLDAAKASMASLAATSQQSAAAQRQSAQATAQQGQAAQQAAQQTNEFNASMEKLFANSRRSLSVYQRLRGEVLSLITTYVGLYAAISGVQQVLQASMDLQAARSRLNVVTDGNQAATAAELIFVRKEADRLGFSFTTLSEQWSKFAAATKGTNITLDESRKIFTSLSEAGRVLKLDNDAMNRSFLAVTQMVSKGTIQMEELRGQLGEHLPGAFATMADAVGVSQGKLAKMMEQGKLTADYLIPFADQLNRKYGGQLQNALQSTQAEIGRFQTAMTMALNVIAESGVLDAFTRALKELRTQLNSDEGQAGLKKIGAVIGTIIDALMVVIKNLDIIAIMFVALGAAKGTAQIMAMWEAFRTLTTGIRTATTATAALSAATATLGGPLGIAIGALAAGFVYLTTRVTDNEKAIQSSQRTIEEITAAYRGAKDGAVDWGKALQNVTIQEQARNAEKLGEAWKQTRESVGVSFERTFNFSKQANLLGDRGGALQQVMDLITELRNGRKTVQDFRNQVSQIGEANPAIGNITLMLLDQTKGLSEVEKAATQASAALRLMQGTATDADKAQLGLTENTEASAESLKKAQTAAEQYKAALDDLKKENPVTKLEVQRDKDLEAIKNSTDAALKAAANMPGGLTPAIKAEIEQAARDARDSVMRAFSEGQLRAIAKVTSEDTLSASVNLIKGFESYRRDPYYDVNAYRNGYGSDTMTAPDGRVSRVTATSTTTEQDALRDLVRRIGEFQDAIKLRIGETRFNAFSPEQQAALTSIAYNYGSLPERIIKAVKEGSSSEIAAAVRTLKGDNGGINSGRREKEAAILGQQNLSVDSMKAREDAKLAEAERKKLEESVKRVNDQLTVRELRERQTRLEAEIYNETVAKGIPLESAAGQLIAERVKKLYASTAAAEARTAAEKRLNELLGLRNQLQTALENAQDRGQTEKAAEYAARLKDVNLELQKQQEASSALISLLDRKKELQDQINLQSDSGNTEAVAALRLELEGVVAQLEAAVQKSNELGLSLSSPAIQLARQSMKAINTETKNYADSAISAKQINQDFANGLTNAFSTGAQHVAKLIAGTESLSDAFKGAAQAFLQFAADFLMQIAQMIIKQMILNALSSFFGGASGTGGIGGAIAGAVGGASGTGASAGVAMAGVAHTGGIAGSTAVSRTANPAWFANAARYHTGGIAGLQPNETATILEKGEEVLPETDPRHVKNGGLGGVGGGAPVQLAQTLVLDPNDIHRVAASPAGVQTTLSVIKANAPTIKQMLKN